MEEERGEIADAYVAATLKLETYNPFIDIQKRVIPVENVNSAGEKWIRGCQTNHIMVIRNCSDVSFYVSSNQRVNTFFIINCHNISFTILDSVVIANRTVRAINCQNCTFVFEDVDVRHFECYGVTNSKAIYIDSPPVVENSKVHWRAGCGRNLVQLGRLRPRGSDDTPHAINYDIIDIYPVPDVPVDGECVSYFDELQHLHHTSFGPDPKLPKAADILKDLEDLEKIPFNLTKEELTEAYDRERDEFEEPIESVKEKVKEVVKILKESKHSIVYTGAGISTSANIPDFRGPQGVWTLKAKGIAGKGFSDDDIRPTYAHYAVTELARRNLVNFVISTNMDALHMRSGTPRHLICEQHGNGNKEVCTKCKKAFYRQYRTSYSTDFFTHHTGRFCDFCNGALRDTIVNFSEVLAEEDMHISLLHARKSEAALVLGTSMNVQPAASFPDKCFRNDGKLIIVNLQKTPYDAIANVRIYAKTDNFMQLLMEELGITNFDQTADAISQWDAPDDETPMPFNMRKKYEAQQRREMLWKWAGIAAASIAVVASVGIGWWIRKNKL